MADVFISYAREDVAAADRRGWERVITDAGMTVWRDAHIASGSTWTSDVGEQLRNAKAIFVIWSEHSWNSHWVRQEAFYGLMKGNLVPIMLKERPAQLELPFSAVQTRLNDSAGLKATLEALKVQVAKG
ncbi:MAG: toll/interleukin-1 receptor domain-containing protein [Hyphomonadaceae bacterium]